MSFPRYPEYKASGVEWLGDIPESWTITRIKSIAYIQYGIGEPPKYYDEGTPLIRATNLHAGKIFIEGLVFVNPIEIHKNRVVWLSEGDIIVVRSGAYTGDSAIIPVEFGPCIAGFDLVLKCHSSNPEFLQFALLSKYLKDGQIDLHKMRAAQPHLNAEELGSCFFLVPRIDDQTNIVDFLKRETAKIDGLIEEQRRLVELLKEKRQAVISHAVTKGLNPNAPMKPSGIEWLGDIPEHWEVGPIKRFWTVTDCKHLTGEFVESGIPLASIREVQSKWVDLSNAKQTTQIFYEMLIGDGRKPDVGDLVFSRNATVGEVAQVNIETPLFAMGQDVCLLRKINKSFSSDFYQDLIKSIPIVEQINILMVGATFKRINVDEIRNLSVVSPPAEEQDEIAEFLIHEVSTFVQLISEAEKSITLLQERRTALISAAVTGKIDVRGLSGVGED